MGSEEKKRRRERFLLDRFLEYQGIRVNSIDQPKPPNPDFVVNLDGRMVGIQMTGVFIRPDESTMHRRGAEQPLLQERESISDLIVSRAREIYFEANDTLVLSKILFSQITRDKREGKEIAKVIADKIQGMVSANPSETVDWKPGVFDYKAQPLSDAVGFIHVCRVPEKRFARWTVMNPGFVTTLTPKHLQDRIDFKAQKLMGYRKEQKIEDVWLLIVADRTRPSQRFQRNVDTPFESLSSPFNKTFYYCYAADEPVLEL